MTAKTEQKIQLRKSLMRLLARREQSRLELYQKMQKKGFTTDLINSSLDDFRNQDWQSDARYADMLVHSRLLKCHGPVKIEMELKYKGIETEVIDRSLDMDIDWIELASTAVNKKYASFPSAQSEIKTCFQFLKQRGFTSEQIRNTLSLN